MAQERRSSASITDQKGIGNGPYLARIISHLDPSFMGSLEVTLLRDQGNQMGDDTQTHIVRCASPFFGYTNFEAMGQNSAIKSGATIDAYNDTQKSYGMWMVPPDVGITVLVVFVDGDPSQGYWIGCIPSRFANHMVPAIGGSTEVDLDKDDKTKYNTKQPLPVAEVNRRLNAENQEINPEKIKKPVHPIADRFLEQGLLEDDVRGVTTSTSRREAPSMVFGISTPGPLDRRPSAKKSNIGSKKGQTSSPVPISRLGGTQFVMDDGDERYQRKTPADKGPVQYADVVAGEKGEPTIPYNEYFRVRTRTGHQILMHNSEDLIYIGNARGTTWVELTSNGKIDIYAKDSVSVHTETDINIRADRDINLEAGRNINMKAVSGRMQLETQTNFNLIVGAGGFITTGGALNVNTGGANKFTSGGPTDINSGGNLTMSAPKIDLNGPAAASASKASRLSLADNVLTDNSQDWGKTKYLKTTPLKSIMKRIPMHEPWLLHENQAPAQLTPKNTDREV
jgi:hypothetical protein